MQKVWVVGIGIIVAAAVAFFITSQKPKSNEAAPANPYGTEESKPNEGALEATPESSGSVAVEEKTTMDKVPDMQINKAKKYQAVLHTSEGDITVDLYADKTPITVNNFIVLAKNNFYNNTIFHRVIKGFMIQGGDPKGDGTGGPGYQFDDEKFDGEYTRGTIAMANAGPNTNGSQFFIMHADYALPKNYIIFGKVSKGIEVVDKIAEAPVSRSAMGENSQPVTPVKVNSVDIVEK